MLPKIISFSGRTRCGKTTLANTCEKAYGYTIISMAYFLKKLVAEKLLHTPIEELEKMKDHHQQDEIKFDKDEWCEILRQELNVNKKKIILKDTYRSIREILQHVGTDVIRRIDDSWHIKQVKKFIMQNEHLPVCIPDIRFKNELKMINELNGVSFFIIRPNQLCTSNHSSEIDLKWTDFDERVIINDAKTEKEFQENWVQYLNTMAILAHPYILKTRLQLIYMMCENDARCLTPHFQKMCKTFLVYYNPSCYQENRRFFLDKRVTSVNGFSIYKNDEHNVTLIFSTSRGNVALVTCQNMKTKNQITTKQGVYSFEVNNPFILENYKLFAL